jgi:hypothetical protein
MKKTISMMTSCLMIAGAAQAAVIAYDNFATDGALDGSSGGSGFSDSWSGGSYTVSTGVVNGSGASFRTLSTEFGSTGEVWMSFDAVRNSGSSYGFVSLFDGGTERLIVGDWFGQDEWSMEVKGGSRYNTSIDNSGTYRTAVVKLSLDTGGVDLWVGDDAVTAIDITAAADISATGATLAGVDSIRIGNGMDVSVGGLILGDTYQDVNAIPEPATLGLIGVFGGGLLFIRRRFSI